MDKFTYSQFTYTRRTRTVVSADVAGVGGGRGVSELFTCGLSWMSV